jgi:2-oxoglutarate/2-oxoacid ferredoxin oxidoreductase subunit alpha
MLLTDGYLQNAAEPWKVPDMSEYTPFPVKFREEAPAEGEKFEPYARNEKLARPWVKPGTPGLLHRIGGIEKKQGTGNIDYSPDNHQEMTDTRKAKVDRIVVPDQRVELGETRGKLAIVGWGSTFGPIHQAVRRARRKGVDVAHIHIRHIWPMPANLGVLLEGYERILVPEMNTGQLKTVLRDQFLVDAKPLNKVSGQPFKIAEIEAAIEEALR